MATSAVSAVPVAAAALVATVAVMAVVMAAAAITRIAVAATKQKESLFLKGKGLFLYILVSGVNTFCE